MDRPALVSIPAGHFLMGCERGRDEEKPEHRVWVDAFELGVHQVRNCDYAVFLKSTGHTPPPEWNSPHFDRADMIVSLDADFLGHGPGRLRAAHDFALRRRVWSPNPASRPATEISSSSAAQ